MATVLKSFFLKAFLFASFTLFSFTLKAQLLSAARYKTLVVDSAGERLLKGSKVTASFSVNGDAETDADNNSKALTNAGLGKLHEQKRLMAYLKKVNQPIDINGYQSNRKFLYHVANIFARLRMYPLAMKFYFKSLKPRPSQITDSLRQHAGATADTLNIDPGYLALNSKDDSVVNKETFTLTGESPQKKSKNIACKRIINLFNDGKKAVAYAMLFHVKQPVPGKRKIFVLTNTGHTFITLIKYNADSTSVSASFGFYPKKDQLFSATPLFPSSSATFKDDAGHPWDETLGKFISKRKFEKILALTRQYEDLDYHLSSNNCTDFGIKAIAIAGINIALTAGSWPLGSGNNPAVTGQSILSGKFNNTDPGGKDDLYVDSVIDK